MPYRIKRSETVQRGIRRIATEQIDNAICEIDDESADPHFVIHQVRRRCKKLRGLIRLVRPSLGKEYGVANSAFRDAAEPLSVMRDAQSIIATFDELIVHLQSQIRSSEFGFIRDALSRRLDEITGEEIKHQLVGVRRALVDSRVRVKHWKLSTSGFNALGDGIAKTHHRAAVDLKDALEAPESEVLHRLRKNVKYHWYHVLLLRGVWPAMMNPYATSLKETGEALGSCHDLAVLRETILNSPEDFGSRADIADFTRLSQQHLDRISATTLEGAQRLFAESADAFKKRLKAYWRLW